MAGGRGPLEMLGGASRRARFDRSGTYRDWGMGFVLVLIKYTDERGGTEGLNAHICTGMSVFPGGRWMVWNGL